MLSFGKHTHTKIAQFRNFCKDYFVHDNKKIGTKRTEQGQETLKKEEKTDTRNPRNAREQPINENDERLYKSLSNQEDLNKIGAEIMKAELRGDLKRKEELENHVSHFNFLFCFFVCLCFFGVMFQQFVCMEILNSLTSFEN